MLVGLITKNGILIVEFANQLRDARAWRRRRGGDRGGDPAPAADPDDHRWRRCSARCRWRWRPARARKARQQIGWVIVGGLLLGTLLTLSVVPVAYTLLARKVHHTAEEAAEWAERETAVTDEPRPVGMV
ncbi:MAG: hypothetical protein MZV65_13795 [Chromatiales bacterium]|nr:hypothetical protein [Chromatiales bacterium]